MKKIISFLAAAIVCVAAFAQENGNRDAAGNIVRGPYVANGTSFWDNTFIELQGGADWIGSPHMGRNNGAKSIYPGLALGANFGKWFSPVLGLRLGWEGLNGQWKPGADLPSVEVGGEVVRKYDHHYAHADFMVNVSNWWSGYKETRVWDVIPYIHAGYLNFHRTDVAEDATHKFGAGVGLYNRFRITNRFGLSLDLRGVISDNKIFGEEFIKSVDHYRTKDFTQGAGGYVSALAGIYVNLGTTGWHRVNTPAEEIACNPDQAMLDEQAAVLAAEEKAEAAYKAAVIRQNAAADAYTKALEDIDVYGRVTPALYEKLGIDSATAEAYATIANVEDCPDFTLISKKETKEWNTDHKAILPEGWDKLSKDEKNALIAAAIFAPAEAAATVFATTEKELVAANKEVKAACDEYNNAVNECQALLDKTAAKVDANGNILPACYPDVDEATAQKYCDLVNSNDCPDFTTLTNKEIRQWTKAHKDILPADWKKMNSVQKNQWLNSIIVCPATLAKDQNAFAEQELAKAKAGKAEADEFYKNCLKPIVPEGSAPKLFEVESVGFFTIGHSVFNDKQMANWKKTLKGIDKRCDYVVTGYADKETGSAERNAVLRQERCEYVKGLLEKEGFTGIITARPANQDEKYVNSPIWKNRSAVIR